MNPNIKITEVKQKKMKNIKKFNSLFKWIGIGIIFSTIIYNAITNVAIRENELKHILENQDKIIQRIERIENYLWIK